MSLLTRLFHPAKPSRVADYETAATTIESIIEGRAKQWDWDEFTSIRKKDPFLESVRTRCVRVADEYPSKDEHTFCAAEGMGVLRSLVKEIRDQVREVQGDGGA